MPTEKTIDANKRRSRERKWRARLQEMVVWAKEEGKLFCQTCANLDYIDGALKNQEEYTKGFKLKKDKIKTVKDKSGTIYYKQLDYVCPYNHGFSIIVSLDEDEIKLVRDKDRTKKRKLLNLIPEEPVKEVKKDAIIKETIKKMKEGKK